MSIKKKVTVAIKTKCFGMTIKIALKKVVKLGAVRTTE